MFGRLALPSSARSYTRRACIGNWANRPRVRVNRSRIYDSRGELVAIDDATLSYCDATLKLNTNVCETILLSDELRVWCEIRLRPSFIFFTSFWNCIIICTYYTSPPLPVINARRSAGLDLKNNVMCTRCSLAGDVTRIIVAWDLWDRTINPEIGFSVRSRVRVPRVASWIGF